MNPQLTTRLRHLRLSGMVEALPGRVAQAEAAPLPHLEFLELLVEDELARRADRLFVRRLKQAGITVMKTLADFDWTFNAKIPKGKLVELASARFVASHSGVLLIGPPGVGKSHVATALAIGAIRAGRRALVRSNFDLAADFAQAEATGARREPRPAADARRPAGPRRFRHEEARSHGGRGPARDLRPPTRSGVDTDYNESTNAGLGRLSR
jgi:DNA replication protein DnaC